MTLKEFIQNNDITGFEIIENITIISVIVKETTYALNVNTDNIIAGTPVIKINNYTIENDILSVNGLQLNINETILEI